MKKKNSRLRTNKENFEADIDGIILDLKILKDARRRKILDVCYKNPMIISKIGEKLKLNDRILWRDLKSLDRGGLIKMEKKEKEKGRPVYVESFTNSFELPGLIASSVEFLEGEYESLLK